VRRGRRRRRRRRSFEDRRVVDGPKATERSRTKPLRSICARGQSGWESHV
jgi:hypothetical protein